jgi:hypothetical protein
MPRPRNERQRPTKTTRKEEGGENQKPTTFWGWFTWIVYAIFAILIAGVIDLPVAVPMAVRLGVAPLILLILLGIERLTRRS